MAALDISGKNPPETAALENGGRGTRLQQPAIPVHATMEISGRNERLHVVQVKLARSVNIEHRSALQGGRLGSKTAGLVPPPVPIADGIRMAVLH